MPITIQIQNFKGGVGKTTTSVNLAASLARKGKKVLLIDLDHQGNTTKGLGYVVTETTPTIFHVLKDIDFNFLDAVATVRENLDLIPSDSRTAGLEDILHSMPRREEMLRIKLENADAWDIIILDCPPAHGLIHLNALLFAEHIIFPVTPEVWSYDGLEGVLSSIRRMQKYFNYKPNIIGALPTIVDERYSLTSEVKNLLEQTFGKEKLLPRIRTDAKLKHSQKKGQTIFEFSPRSRAAADYDLLAAEVLKRVGLKKNKKAG
jgi:chromosome partitioning protein